MSRTSVQRPPKTWLCFLFMTCHLMVCHAIDEAHCLRSHKEVTSSCSANGNDCMCALQKIKCRTTSQCKTVIADNQMCVNQLNHDNALWITNCGIYHDNDFSLTIIGWVVVYILAGTIVIIMWNKSALERQGSNVVPNIVVALLFVGIVVTGALCFRDMFLVLMVAMVCILFLIITITMVHTQYSRTSTIETASTDPGLNSLPSQAYSDKSGLYMNSQGFSVNPEFGTQPVCSVHNPRSMY